jgi:arylsulfatase A-like enzyme
MFVDLMRFQTSHSADSLATGDSTLAEQLAERGYRTSGVASMPWFVGPYGLQKGFERMLIVRGDDRARQVVDRALDWTVRAVERPHFLFLHFSDVHDYRAPASFVARYHDGNYRGQFAGRATRATANLGQGVDAADLRYLEALYDAAATYVDSELGRFFAELRRRGLYDDALILVTADHGEAFLEHGHTGHGFSLYEEELRVPLVVKPPRSFPVATRRSEAWTGLVDLLPTVLDYVGGEPPAGVVGTSLRAAIEGRALPERRLYAGATMYLSSYAALENERIFIHRHVPPLELFRLRRWLPNLRAFYTFGASELFDLALDPGERHDLAPADPALAVGMERAIIEELAVHRRSAHELTFGDEEMRKIRALGYLR